MSTFDDPFDAERRLNRTGCVCGRHRSQAEHEQAAQQLQCASVEPPIASGTERYQDVVASAVMRAVFPQDRARRLFLPLNTASEAFAQAGTPEKKDLKVGFIPITCATPSSWRTRWASTASMD